MEISSYSNNLCFSSRNIRAREVDKICRNVHREIPVLSSTRANTYSCVQDKGKGRYCVYRLGQKVRALRNSHDGSETWLCYLIDSMKKFKVGNCQEQADALGVALRINGYENTHSVALFAYNPKTKSVRDLDHVVAAVDLKLPKRYRYLNAEIPALDQLISPHNGSIIADPWAGFVDAGQGFVRRYKENPRLYPELQKDEKLMYGVLQPWYISEIDLMRVKSAYPRFDGSKTINDVYVPRKTFTQPKVEPKVQENKKTEMLRRVKEAIDFIFGE